MGQVVEDAISDVVSSNPNIAPAHYDMRFLKPIDTEILDHVANFKRVITIEDGVRKGGLGSEVAEYFAARAINTQIVSLGLPDEFVEHGSPAELYRLTGLDKQSIIDEIIKPLP